MKRGKWRLGILILCLIAAGAALWTLCRNGWTWRVPEALVQRVSIQRLSDNLDALTRDGFVEADDDRRLYFQLGWSATSHPGEGPGEEFEDNGERLLVWFEEDESPQILLRLAESGAPEGEVRASAWTRLVRSLSGNPFQQGITLSSSRGSLRIVRCTSGLFSGRRALLADLETFCDRYFPQ